MQNRDIKRQSNIISNAKLTSLQFHLIYKIYQ